jgi:protein disulfide-isomerase A6
VIAKLDADAPTGKTTAAKYGISGFPTLKFFSKDSTEPETYDNQRSEEALAQFLNTKAGTFRAVGGGLNEMAGRISAFDEVAEKLVKGDASSLKDVSETIKKLAEESNEPYAAYYVKVLDKLSKNDEDAERELKRIQGILKKGGLARKKVDEFTCKTNILSRFVLEKKPEVKDEL